MDLNKLPDNGILSTMIPSHFLVLKKTPLIDVSIRIRGSKSLIIILILYDFLQEIWSS